MEQILAALDGTTFGLGIGPYSRVPGDPGSIPDVPNDAASAHEYDELGAAMRAHEESERKALRAYRQLASASSDPLVRELMRLVIEDEVRHHRVFGQLAAMVRHPALAGAQSEPPRRRPAEDLTLEIAMVQFAISAEEDGARDLRRLAQHCSQLHDGIVALILDLIARDSLKHAAILQQVLKRLEAALCSSPVRTD
ncbi:MAG: Rubrerythrin [Chloroflexota bacterium]|jgi:rubrerythrin|nr:Rubrerythrin [Chloroflexota bacterium]